MGLWGGKGEQGAGRKGRGGKGGKNAHEGECNGVAMEKVAKGMRNRKRKKPIKLHYFTVSITYNAAKFSLSIGRCHFIFFVKCANELLPFIHIIDILRSRRSTA